VADGLSLPARVLQSPRVGFGLTTLALVGLASTGTGLLVSHGTSQLQPPVQHVVPTQAPPPLTPVVVDRAPGTFRPSVPSRPRVVRVVVPAAPQQDRGAVTAPPAVVDVPPVVDLPPVVGPPVVVPPVLPPGPVLTPSAHGGKKKPHPPHPDDNGKHLGQQKH
jgi:hypothetical protein